MNTLKPSELPLEYLWPTRQVVAVLRANPMVTRKKLWVKLQEAGTSIQSANQLRKALRRLVAGKRVRTYAYKPLIEKGLIPTSSRNFLYEVNEPSEQRIERKTKDHRRYPRQTMELLGLDPQTGRPFEEEKKEDDRKVIEIDADFKELELKTK